MVSFVKGKLSKLLSLALLILDIHDITIKKKNHHVYAQIVLNNFWTFLIRNGSKYITSKQTVPKDYVPKTLRKPIKF